MNELNGRFGVPYDRELALNIAVAGTEVGFDCENVVSLANTHWRCTRSVLSNLTLLHCCCQLVLLNNVHAARFVGDSGRVSVRGCGSWKRKERRRRQLRDYSRDTPAQDHEKAELGATSVRL